MVRWPAWWQWELELSPHLFKRMVDRGFSETDLREMLDSAISFHADPEPGRWVVETRLGARHVIVEPDEFERLLIVITAFPVDGP